MLKPGVEIYASAMLLADFGFFLTDTLAEEAVLLGKCIFARTLCRCSGSQGSLAYLIRSHAFGDHCFERAGSIGEV